MLLFYSSFLFTKKEKLQINKITIIKNIKFVSIFSKDKTLAAKILREKKLRK